jgi:hypothetical protein
VWLAFVWFFDPDGFRRAKIAAERARAREPTADTSK